MNKITSHLRSALLLSLSTPWIACDPGEESLNLPPIPTERIKCSGTSSEYEGPCCVEVYCVPADTSMTCKSVDETSEGNITGESLGSGSCACGEFSGPYAAPDTKSKDCCYLVGIQSCSGRPMWAEGQIIRSSVLDGERWFT